MKELENYLTTLSLLKKSELTINQYRHDIELFLKVLGIQNVEDMSKITVSDISNFYDYAANQQWSNNTLNLKMMAIKLFVKYLISENGIKTKAFDKIHKLPEDTKATRALTEDECNLILNYMNKHRTNSRNFTLFNFILDSGLRKFEYIKLRLSDLKDNKLFVVGKRGKKCDILLRQETIELLKKYVNNERAEIMAKYNQKHDYIFVSNTGKQMDRTSFLKSIKKYAKEVGIKDWGNVTVHGIRHSGLSIFYNKTKDIKATAIRARHTNPSLTLKTYVHIDENEMLKQIESCGFQLKLGRIGT